MPQPATDGSGFVADRDAKPVDGQSEAKFKGLLKMWLAIEIEDFPNWHDWQQSAFELIQNNLDALGTLRSGGREAFAEYESIPAWMRATRHAAIAAIAGPREDLCAAANKSCVLGLLLWRPPLCVSAASVALAVITAIPLSHIGSSLRRYCPCCPAAVVAACQRCHRGSQIVACTTATAPLVLLRRL